jgi:hypothetical protein
VRPSRHAPREQRVYLAREPDRPVHTGDVQRLLPEPVSHQQNATPGPIESCECEQAVAAFDPAFAPRGEHVEKRLRVAPAPVWIGKLCVQLEVVEDLPVVGDQPPPRPVFHRLTPGRAGRDDFESRVGEADVPVHGYALLVRPSMGERGRHSMECLLVGLAARRDDATRDTAHEGGAA